MQLRGRLKMKVGTFAVGRALIGVSTTMIVVRRMMIRKLSVGS